MYKIEKIDGDIATLTFNDQTLSIDRNRLPVDVQEGDELEISAITSVESTTESATENPTENEEIVEMAEEEKIEES